PGRRRRPRGRAGTPREGAEEGRRRRRVPAGEARPARLRGARAGRGRGARPCTAGGGGGAPGAARGEPRGDPGRTRMTLGAPLRAFDEVDSTQETLRELARSGAPEGTVVVAEHQRAGRGRRGRAWNDRPGESLLFSVLLT